MRFLSSMAVSSISIVIGATIGAAITTRVMSNTSRTNTPYSIVVEQVSANETRVMTAVRNDGKLVPHGIVGRFVDGRCTEERMYWRGIEEAVRREYDEMGRILVESDTGSANRPTWDLFYHPDGSLAGFGMMRSGIPDGVRCSFHPEGQIKALWQVRDRKLNGPSVEWYESGTTKVEGTYRDGLKQGRWTHWNENGTVLAQEEWKQGERVARTDGLLP